jgi:hypothetical protein
MQIDDRAIPQLLSDRVQRPVSEAGDSVPQAVHPPRREVTADRPA